MKNQKGFVRQNFDKNFEGSGAVEALLIVIIVGLIGFVGWYVWHSKQLSDKSLNSASSTNQTSSVAPQEYKKTTSVPASWVTYSNKDFKFSIAHPSGWVVNAYMPSKPYVDPNQTYEVDMATSNEKDCGCATVYVKVYKQDLNSTVTFEKTTLKQPKSENNITSTSLKFDGNDAVKLNNPDSGALSDTVYVIHKDTYTYVITVFKDSSDNKISNDTLTSFESLRLN